MLAPSSLSLSPSRSALSLLRPKKEEGGDVGAKKVVRIGTLLDLALLASYTYVQTKLQARRTCQNERKFCDMKNEFWVFVSTRTYTHKVKQAPCQSLNCYALSSTTTFGDFLLDS